MSNWLLTNTITSGEAILSYVLLNLHSYIFPYLLRSSFFFFFKGYFYSYFCFDWIITKEAAIFLMESVWYQIPASLMCFLNVVSCWTIISNGNNSWQRQSRENIFACIQLHASVPKCVHLKITQDIWPPWHFD